MKNTPTVLFQGFMATLDQVRECRSPHVVTLYGYYKAVKYFWVVMEFCHGFSVHNLMTELNRPLKESQIRTVVSHALRGEFGVIKASAGSLII